MQVQSSESAVQSSAIAVKHKYSQVHVMCEYNQEWVQSRELSWKCSQMQVQCSHMQVQCSQV